MSLKSSSVAIVKLSMDLLMDAYFIDQDKYVHCKNLVEKHTKSDNVEIKEFADELLNDKLVNPYWEKIKNIAVDHYWIIFALILFLIIGFEHGFKEGFLIVCLVAAGQLLGLVLCSILNIILRRDRFVSNIKLFTAFIILTGLLYFIEDSRPILIFMIPLSLPAVILGFVGIIRSK